jgi:molybdenum cofactor biosynthesis enzyme MoaA
VIFTKQAFNESYLQSPGYKHFAFSQGMDGITDTMPIDLHVDLGNHCNLACKMCWPGASSKIATQYVKWGYDDNQQYLGTDWTKDTVAWQRFLNELLTIPKFKNIHLMGGETLLSPRFEELVDFMIMHERFDISFSFVTNGTVYKPKLLEKLKKFARVGIEISIETITKHNDYVRQGSTLSEVLTIIDQYQQLCNNSNISLTIRPAISLLTIGYYYTLLEYCLKNHLLIKSMVVSDPYYLDSRILPDYIKSHYLPPYEKILAKLTEEDTLIDYNESNPENYKQAIKHQAHQVINLLTTSTHINHTMEETVNWMKKWDTEFGFNARTLYPEFNKILDDYGY